MKFRRDKKIKFIIYLVVFAMIFSISSTDVVLLTQLAKAEDITQDEQVQSVLIEDEPLIEFETEPFTLQEEPPVIEEPIPTGSGGSSGNGNECREKEENKDDECILELIKTDAIDPVSPGDDVIYNMTLENIGTADCTGSGVRLRDVFDVNTTFVSANPEPEDATGEYVQWNFETIEPGEVAEAELIMNVSEGVSYGSILINTARYWSYQTGAGGDVIEETTIVSDNSICGIKYYDFDRDGQFNNDDYNISDWVINLWPKYVCEEGDEWTDSIISFNQGLNSAGGPVVLERSNPDEALGEAENDDTLNFVSLGIGGELIIYFQNFIENGPGNDIKVVETSYGSPTCYQYPEVAHVYASQYGNNWTSLGRICLDGAFDLGSLGWAKFIKIVDETDPENFSGTVDGFDVDGVKAIHCLNRGDKMTTATTDNGYCFSELEKDNYIVCEELIDGWRNSTPICQQVSFLEEDDQDIEINVDFGNFALGEADYEMSKELVSVGNIYPGDTIEFVLTIENTGELDIYQMSISDEYDSDYLIFMDAAPTMPGYVSTGTIAWYDEFSPSTPLLLGESWIQNIFFFVKEGITENVTSTNSLFITDVLDENSNPVDDSEFSLSFNILAPSPPEPYCGDGNLDLGEQCDDGNNISGDGCSAECTIEGSGGPSTNNSVGTGSQYNPPATPEEGEGEPGEEGEEPGEGEAPGGIEPEVLGVKVEGGENEDPTAQVLGYDTLPDTSTSTSANSLNYLFFLGMILLAKGLFLKIYQSRKFKK